MRDLEELEMMYQPVDKASIINLINECSNLKSLKIYEACYLKND
jgi:hypothetical protein